MKRPYRRLAITLATGAALLGGIALLPDSFVVRNTSLSMDLGWYVRVPFATPVAGSIVVFSVPEKARSLADKACIRGTLIKRVIYRHPNGDLYLAGDHGGARSLDSRYFGAIPETAIIGVYKLAVEKDPGRESREEGTQDKALRSEGGGCHASGANDSKDLTDSTSTLPAMRVDESPTRVTLKW